MYLRGKSLTLKRGTLAVKTAHAKRFAPFKCLIGSTAHLLTGYESGFISNIPNQGLLAMEFKLSLLFPHGRVPDPQLAALDNA